MKHIYFSGIGGAGIGPLALIAHQAGFKVSGSDKQNSDYIEYLIKNGVTDIHIGQDYEQISGVNQTSSIDWLVYSSAVSKENTEHPELKFATDNGIKSTKRDEFLNYLLSETNQKMIAVAGTHGKTTTTAMMVWLFTSLKLPISYSVGAKLSFGPMGKFDKDAHYFIYEADEYDKNFLSFNPEVSVIPGIAYDHPDVYPTKEVYLEAFRTFLSQSDMKFLHDSDAKLVGEEIRNYDTSENDFTLLGKVNRLNAMLVVQAMHDLSNIPIIKLVETINKFPGISRRFEKVSNNVYTDYAHTPEKIRGALQLAREVSGDNVVVVYEGLHNTRQHFIKEELKELFTGIKQLYVVPSYLAREDKSLEMLTPEKLVLMMNEPALKTPSKVDENLKSEIKNHARNGTLVLCLSAGGGGSLDEWLRREFSK